MDSQPTDKQIEDALIDQGDIPRPVPTPLAKAGLKPRTAEERTKDVQRKYAERLRALCYEKPKEAKAKVYEHLEEFFSAFNILSEDDAVHKHSYHSFVSAGMILESSLGEVKDLLSAFAEVSEDWQ